MKSIVSEKGRVTIPRRLRDRLGIKPGEVLEVEEEEVALVARKTGSTDGIDEIHGIVTLGRPTDELVDQLRRALPAPRSQTWMTASSGSSR
jgi:antitoxin PrlF